MLSRRVLVVLVVVFAVVKLSFCTNDTEPVCIFQNVEDCIDECFLERPPMNVYLNEGDSIVLSVEVHSSVSLVLFSSFFNGTSVSSSNNKTLCDPTYCIFDLDSPRLEIVSFNASMSVGSYRFDIGGVCTFPFDIIQAVPPSIQKEANPPLILNNDEGGLTFAPIIYHGLPPGEVIWLKDGVNISTGDIYTKDPVMAEDRGVYTARIDQLAGTVTLDYELLVQFSMATLVTDPIDTNPAMKDPNQPIKITCNALSYPAIDPGDIFIMETNSETKVGVVTTESILQPGLHYEAKVEYTIASGCPSLEFFCQVNNDVVSVRSETIRICQKAVTVTMVTVDSSMSTDETAHLEWILDPLGAIVSVYEIMYRLKGTQEYTTISSSDTTNSFHLIEGLSPGKEYEFKVRAIDSSESTDDLFSSLTNFTTFRNPIYVPTGLMVSRNQTSIHLLWNQPSDVPAYAPIGGYEVYYYKSDSPTPVIVPVNSGTNSYSLVAVEDSLTYFFAVRATNDWGIGDTSTEVEARPILDVDPNPLDVKVTLTVGIREDLALVDWTIQSESETITRLTITISRIESFMLNDVQFFHVITYNVTGTAETEKCFSNLNVSETYQFCIQPFTDTRTNLPSTCSFGTISASDSSDSDAYSRCYPVAMEMIASGQVIPSWAIAVIVVGAVCLVFVFFGGCGLYFGLKRNKKADQDYEGHNETFDKLPHDGNYPYPPPPPRSMSPPRNCMSYRHNSQGHHLDWQGVTAV